MTSLDRLAAKIASMERQIKGLSAPSLAYSSIEDGAVEEYDGNGTLVQIIGTQFDGTHMAAPVNGPPPPVPSAPRVTAVPGGLTIAWDGFWADVEAITPVSFSRVEVHVVPIGASYNGSAAYLRATIETPRGADVTVSPLSTIEYRVVLVARTLAGVASAASAPTAGTPLAGGTTGGEVDPAVLVAVPRIAPIWGERRTNGLSTTTTERPYLELRCQLPVGRLCEVSVVGMGVNTNLAGARVLARIRHSVGAGEVSTTSAHLAGRRYAIPVAGTGIAVDPLYAYVVPTGTEGTMVEHRFLLTLICEQGAGFFSPQSAVVMVVRDAGVFMGDTGIERDT